MLQAWASADVEREEEEVRNENFKYSIWSLHDWSWQRRAERFCWRLHSIITVRPTISKYFLCFCHVLATINKHNLYIQFFRSTHPFIHSESLTRVPALAEGEGGKVTAVGLQVKMFEPISGDFSKNCYMLLYFFLWKILSIPPYYLLCQLIYGLSLRGLVERNLQSIWFHLTIYVAEYWSDRDNFQLLCCKTKSIFRAQ